MKKVLTSGIICDTIRPWKGKRKEIENMTIKNIAEYAKTKKYIVAREIDGEYWFFSAWDDANKANAQALEFGGEVFRTEDLT